MILEILQDALFSAIAAIGFAAISRPPKGAYLLCAVIAAVGHSVRFVLMNPQLGGLNIVMSTLVASLFVGTLAVFLSPLVRMPAETCFFPALLPMVPGIYAYKSFAGLALCITDTSESAFAHNFYLFSSNGFTVVAVLFAMVLGATLPVFIFKKTSFQATR